MSSVTTTYHSDSTAYHTSFAYDPIRRVFYERTSYFANTLVYRYDDPVAFESHVVDSQFNLLDYTIGGTYFVALDGDIYGRGYTGGLFPTPSDSFIVRWDAATGAVEAVGAPLPGITGGNGSGAFDFDWGGFSGPSVFLDGTDLLALGRVDATTWTLFHLDTDLNVTSSVSFNTSADGYAFVVNGTLFMATNYNSTGVSVAVDIATGDVTNVGYTFDTFLPGSDYVNVTTYDPNTDTLYIDDNAGLFSVASASTVFLDPFGPFTSGDDTVDLNAIDLARVNSGAASQALAGNDTVTLSTTQNVGVAFDAGPGRDSVTGSAGGDVILGGDDADTIVGGLGADTLDGGTGDDQFRGSGADFAAGEAIDGGAGLDTLYVDGGGVVSLAGVTLEGVEAIVLTDAVATTLTVADVAQAALISNAAGLDDTVHIAEAGDITPEVVRHLLLDSGVETVTWSHPGFADVTATAFGSGMRLRYEDNAKVKPFAFIDAFYNALAQPLSQTQVFDDVASNGVILRHTFDPTTGLATRILNVDNLQHRTYATITTYLENGVVTYVDTINDGDTNGAGETGDDTRVEQFFEAGVLRLETTTDMSDGTGRSWTHVDREYAGGVTQIFRTFWDAGVNGGGQQVVGGAGSQVIEGSTTDDHLIGGAGADTFRFAPDFGQDKIYDFVDGTDKLDLRALGIDTFAELDAVASILQVPNGTGFSTVIQFDAADERITIANLAAADLGNGDFVV